MVFVFSAFKSEVIVDVGGVVDRYFLNFVFIMHHFSSQLTCLTPPHMYDCSRTSCHMLSSLFVFSEKMRGDCSFFIYW